MTETAHTPGPWEVAYLDHNGQRVVRSEHIEVCTCWHHSVGSIEKEMEVNARLIAAAPELLALAFQYRDDLRHPPSSDSRERRLAAIEAVISKAEGRS
jgi:hypothetical protein